MVKSDNWDKNEKDNARKLNSDGRSYSGSYPYLPKKVTIVIAAFAILMGIGMIHGILNPSDEPWYDEQIEALDCKGLQEWIIKNKDNNDVPMDYFFKYATLKFLDECSSYGD